jgi:hypothetical protein
MRSMFCDKLPCRVVLPPILISLKKEALVRDWARPNEMGFISLLSSVHLTAQLDLFHSYNEKVISRISSLDHNL